MKSVYVRSQVVNAYPMTYSEYMEIEGAEDINLPADTPGYAIEDDEGYIQWLTDTDFNSEYIEVGDLTHLEEHQKRVMVEYAQTLNRFNKLQKVFNKSIFLALPFEERELFNTQSRVMKSYLQILEKRINLFKP